MNRAERRKAAKAGIQVKKEPTVNVKLSDLGKMMTPTQRTAMMHEIHQQCLEADAILSMDVDTVVLWTLFQRYGWGKKRLHDFYIAMYVEHQRMRNYYQIDDLFPERLKLREKGIDLEEWQKEAQEYAKTLGEQGGVC